jgi:hypothetical protein
MARRKQDVDATRGGGRKEVSTITVEQKRNNRNGKPFFDNF